MNRIFRPRGFLKVPDGTEVSAVLNATDSSQSDVPWGALGNMSIAAGRIEPGTASAIRVHAVVTQVTYVVSGTLSVRMQDEGDDQPYELHLAPGDAVLATPLTLFQIQNRGNSVAEVLYLVSPPYVSEMMGQDVAYDDAVILGTTWKSPATASAPNTYEVRAARSEALRRLAVRKGESPIPLAQESVRPRPGPHDYLAPDGSEIRKLVDGEYGGLAHCILPAGRISAAVRHRTVEELWYVIDGNGDVWRSRSGEDRIDPVRPGDSIRIPVGASFQFRATASADLELIITTMPPWPGPQEAIPTAGKW
jgi:mannose-6-phosphate isomerase-like protein (cupin superfamily)